MIFGLRLRSGSDRSPAVRRVLLLGPAVQIALFAWAAIDLARRPGRRVRGRKRWWWPALFVNFFGPLAYLLFGRR